jgi:hypothetical protein
MPVSTSGLAFCLFVAETTRYLLEGLRVFEEEWDKWKFWVLVSLLFSWWVWFYFKEMRTQLTIFFVGFSFSRFHLLLEKKKGKWVVIGKVAQGRDVTWKSDLVIGLREKCRSSHEKDHVHSTWGPFCQGKRKSLTNWPHWKFWKLCWSIL